MSNSSRTEEQSDRDFSQSSRQGGTGMRNGSVPEIIKFIFNQENIYYFLRKDHQKQEK